MKNLPSLRVWYDIRVAALIHEMQKHWKSIWKKLFF